MDRRRHTGPDTGVTPDASPRFVGVSQDDPRARPLLDELAEEYSARYGRPLEVLHRELLTHPADEFAPPTGGLVIAIIDDEVVAGGAFRYLSPDTAELKRIWTSHTRRRQGLGLRVVAELERRIAQAGYQHIRLTTGWRQPEAANLYVAAGYTPEFDMTRYPVGEHPHPFVKSLHG